MWRRLFVLIAMLAALLMLAGMAAAQAPAGTPAPHEHPATPPATTPATPPATAPAAPPAAAPAAPQCQMGPGGTCVMPGATPEKMKEMQGKMGQCCMMQEGKGCPMHQQVQKQLDDLQKRVEALEGKKAKKK